MRVKGSRGQILPLAIVLLAAGMLVLTPLLSQLATMLQKGGNEREQRMKVYAAETSINRVIADLIRGADGVGTTYTTTQPHTGGSFQTFTITTSYSAPSVTVNDYTPTITISLPTGTQARPATQLNYVDPGVTHPQLATIPGGYTYLIRLYNVKAGTLQVNWAYSPAGISRLGVWAGMPVDNRTNQPYPPGQLDRWPTEQPILDTGFTSATATFNRTAAIAVDPATDGSGGVYTLVFDNSRGTQSKTTAAFAASGGPGDTWVYVKAYKDYIITATVGGVSVSAYLRQVPGYAEPPGVVSLGSNSYSYTFATNNVSFITNGVYSYTWLSP
ncbi:MAG: hypothetical protein HYX99_00050 [Chloroflexi bacterium]|nr:hypothetical protein [Chloroflexota bacterium]